MTSARFVGTGSYLIRCSKGHTKLTHRQLKKFLELLSTEHRSFNLKKSVNFKVAITEMFPRIPQELVAEPLVSADQTL